MHHACPHHDRSQTSSLTNPQSQPGCVGLVLAVHMRGCIARDVAQPSDAHTRTHTHTQGDLIVTAMGAGIEVNDQLCSGQPLAPTPRHAHPEHPVRCMHAVLGQFQRDDQANVDSSFGCALAVLSPNLNLNDPHLNLHPHPNPNLDMTLPTPKTRYIRGWLRCLVLGVRACVHAGCASANGRPCSFQQGGIGTREGACHAAHARNTEQALTHPCCA